MTFTLRNPSKPCSADYVINDTSRAIIYAGSWTATVQSGAYNSDNHCAFISSASVSFSFTGTEVRWIGQMAANYGMALVFVDNVLVDTVDCYSTVDRFQQELFTRSGLVSGPHAICIAPLGIRNAASKGLFIDVDAFFYGPVSHEVKCSGPVAFNHKFPGLRSSERGFQFMIDRDHYTTAAVFYLTGSRIRTLNLTQNALWDRTDSHGMRVKPGVYIIRISGPGSSVSLSIRRME